MLISAVYFGVKFQLGIIGMGLYMAIAFGVVYFSSVGIEKAIFNNNNIKSPKEGAQMDPLVKDFLRSGWSLDQPRA